MAKLSNVENREEGWFYSRKEVEENSPSRRDGIDLKKENRLRKSYCAFLQDLGIKLKIPQQTIATAILFCHRFYLRQSHAKNDRWTIATACMFLAAKSEETPRSIVDVIHVSYQIIHGVDKTIAYQWTKDKHKYQQQMERILQAEKIVLGTLAFDLTVYHPYAPLVKILKKLDLKSALLGVAWNFLNDSLRTSISLQYKAPQIAAGAVYMAAKFRKVDPPFDIVKALEEESDITERQLGDICNQILELYDEKKLPCRQPSNVTETSGSGQAKAANVDAPQISNKPIEIRNDSGDSRNDVRHHEREPIPWQANTGEDSVHLAAMDKSNLWKKDATETLNAEKVRRTFKKRQACEVITHQVDELERVIEDVEVSTRNKKIKKSERPELVTRDFISLIG